MRTGRNNSFIGIVSVGIKRGVFPVNLGNFFPEFFRAVLAPIPDMKRDNLAGLFVKSQPNPLWVGLTTHETPKLVDFGFKQLNFNRFPNKSEIDVQMIRSLFIDLGDKIQSPSQTDTDDAANPT